MKHIRLGKAIKKGGKHKTGSRSDKTRQKTRDFKIKQETEQKTTQKTDYQNKTRPKP